MDMVSEDDSDRGFVDKRTEYAKAGLREYWIVDPRDRSETLQTLKGRKYGRTAKLEMGQTVESKVLKGFSIEVISIFDAAKVK